MRATLAYHRLEDALEEREGIRATKDLMPEISPLERDTFGHYLLRYLHGEVQELTGDHQGAKTLLAPWSLDSTALDVYPFLQSIGRVTLGNILVSLNEYGKADTIMGAALDYYNMPSGARADTSFQVLTLIGYGTTKYHVDEHGLTDSLLVQSFGYITGQNERSRFIRMKILNNRASNAFQVRKYALADSLHREVTALLHTFPEDRLLGFRANFQYSVGHNSHQQRHFRTARRHFLNSIPLAEKGYPEDSLGLAYLYGGAGVVLRVLEDYTPAKSYLEHALALRLPIVGPESLDAAATYYPLGRLYLETKDYARSRYFLEQALRIQENSKEVAAQASIPSTLSTLGLLQTAIGDFEEAEATLLRMLDLQKKSGTSSIFLAWEFLGQLYYRWGDYAKSKNYSQLALQQVKSLVGDQHPYLSNIYVALALATLELGNAEEATGYVRLAKYALQY
ncbi:MAG: tetratricopeptide repeat protein, partial [Bacteroidota bacterium]